MTVREVIKTVLIHCGISQAKFVERIGWSQQLISQRLARNSLRAAEMFRLMEASGIEILFRDKETGEILEILTSGHGHRLKGMSDSVKYDTEAAKALSNSFYADGENEYDENGQAQELYVDTKGRYFLANYDANDRKNEKITAIPKSVADAFREKYGPVIEKK